MPVVRMKFKKYDTRKLMDVIDRWNAQGIKNVPEVILAYPIKDESHVELKYSDVLNLVEVIREFAYKAGYDQGISDSIGFGD